MGIGEATMWRTRIKILLKWVGVGLVLVGLGWLILGGYALEWTGFGEHVNAKGEVEREKTLWDWMNLLIVPIVLAFGGVWFSRQERKSEREIEKERAQTEREIATDRQREAALQMYFDRMTELLLEKGLRTSEEDDEVRDVARARTLAVLRGLDGLRKGMLVKFLYEAGLIFRGNTVLDLRDADLSKTKLRGVALTVFDPDLEYLRQEHPDLVNPRSVNLSGAFLIEADLREADLSEANLNWAKLGDAKLHRIKLYGASLHKTDLHGTDLTDASLNGADLREANLNGANLTDSRLLGAKLVKAKLFNTILHDAELPEATLFGAKLIDADLRGTELVNASLIGAVLEGANLSGADLSGANLKRANLRGATISDEQLAQAVNLEGTILPNGTTYSAPPSVPLGHQSPETETEKPGDAEQG